MTRVARRHGGTIESHFILAHIIPSCYTFRTSQDVRNVWDRGTRSVRTYITSESDSPESGGARTDGDCEAQVFLEGGKEPSPSSPGVGRFDLRAGE